MRFFAENMNLLTNWSRFLAPAAWKGLIILALVFAVMGLWQRSAAAVRHLAWTTTFFYLLCLPVFVQCLPAWRAPAWIIPPVLNNSLPDSLSFVLQNKTRAESQSPQTVLENAVVRHNPTDISSQTAPIKYVTGWSNIVIVLWFAGTVIGLTRLLAVQIRLERMASRMRLCENREWLELIDGLRIEYHLRRRVKLLISTTSSSPMTWGVFRPVIALPADSLQWPDKRLRVVLRHELAHVKRLDCFTQDIACVVCALYWFNPLTWIAAGRMRAEREKACDDFVLNTGTRPSEYANHLVEIAQQFSAANFGGAVAMARPSGLELRVTAILDGRRNRNRIAKMTVASVIAAVFGFGLLVGSYGAETFPQRWSLENSKVAGQLKSFLAVKNAQEGTLIEADEKYFSTNFPSLVSKLMLPDCQPFFAAAANGDWQTLSNHWSELEKHTLGLSKATNGYPHGMWLQPMRETYGAIEAFAAGNEKYSKAFGDDVIQSIPSGSIYFGGTDPGRFIVTALQKSNLDGNPFYTMTQNVLADGMYLNYLRSMYEGNIYIPTAEDSQKCFQAYEEDVAVRFQKKQLKPGEDVQISGARISISGQVAVMEINGLLAKVIFDKNPNREFYIEESVPLDWMRPNLEPHGLIFKINRQPLPGLSDEIVQRDHDYWSQYIQPMIGNWLNDDTSVEEVTQFAAKVFLRHDINGFTGDPQFVQNEYSCEMFSKLRSSIAGLYAWRMNQAAAAVEKASMAHEADIAYRQSLALCPYSPDAVKGYSDFLRSQNRDSDAVLVTEMAKQFPNPK
jgi:beta-lactamase regulating signal transducer with metallopeptidase domain